MLGNITGWMTGMLTTEASLVVLLVLFIVFIILVKKLFSLLINYLWVAIGGALFPLFASLIGVNISLTLENIVFFASSAILLYSVFLTGRTVYRMLSKFESKGNKKIKKLEKEVKKLKEKSTSD